MGIRLEPRRDDRRQLSPVEVGYNVFSCSAHIGSPDFYLVFLSPALGAILMSASTAVVALNAQLLRKLELTSGKGAQCVVCAPCASMVSGCLWHR